MLELLSLTLRRGRRRHGRWLAPTALGVAVLALAACERASKLARLPDEKILAEIARCDSLPNPSSLKQVICDNHRRESQRRNLCSGS